MSRVLTFIALILVILGCTEPKPDEIKPERVCWNQLIIDSEFEYFCSPSVPGLKSNLATGNNLYVQLLYNIIAGLGSSENYGRIIISFANTKSDSTDWEAEATYFENLVKLLRPESKHRLDISELGGFAIELWTLDGEYFSSEYGEQELGTFIEPRAITLTLESSSFNSVLNSLDLHLVSTKPIAVWNQEGTRKINVDTNYIRQYIFFEQFE